MQMYSHGIIYTMFTFLVECVNMLISIDMGLLLALRIFSQELPNGLAVIMVHFKGHAYLDRTLTQYKSYGDILLKTTSQHHLIGELYVRASLNIPFISGENVVAV